MFSSQEWWNGTAAGPAPEPTQIGKSLRFRGAQQLQRTFTSSNASVCTFSCWVKRADVGNADNIFGAASSASQFERIIFNPTPNLSVYSQNGGSDYINVRTAALYRDPSAWYHLVYVKDTSQSTASDRIKIYINGERVSNFESTTYPGQNTSNGSINNNILHTIGRDPDTGVDYLDGYLADVYFIDGQALEPTVFGTLDDNGVWVPAETNFAIGQSKYSDYVYTAEGGAWYSDRTPDKIFNGDTSPANGECMVNDSGDAIVFAPAESISFDTSLEVYTSSTPGTSTIYLNDPEESGAGVDVGLNTWVTVATGSGTIEDLRIRSGSAKANWAGIKVDGVQLLDPNLYSANLFTKNTDTSTPPFDTTDKDFYIGGPVTSADRAFDGSNNTYAGPSNPGSWLVFRPEGGIEVNSTIFIDQNPTGWELESVYINENLVASKVTNPTINFTGTLTNLAIRGQAAGLAATMARLVIDGIPLIDGVNSSYGANGFHLDFSDPSNIGADRSGNGNDFTPSGFDFTTPGKFSARQAGSGPGSYVADPAARTMMLTSPDQTFDGNLFTQCQVGNTASSSDYGGWYYFTPGFYGVTSFWFGVNSSAIATEVRINGESVNFTTGNAGPSNVFGDNWVIVDVPADGIVTEFAFTSAGAATNTQINGILLNGDQEANLLLDNLGTDYDLMQDSPTQNWATMQPLLPTTGPYYSGNYSKANQVAGGATTAFATSGNTIHIPTTGKWYAEAELVNTNSYNNNYIGIASEDTDVGNNTNGFFWGQNNSGDFYDGDTGVSLGRYEALAEGDICGIAFDADTNEITMYKNGVLNFSGTAGSKIDGYKDNLIFLTRPYYNSGQTLGLNMGQRPFVYTPPEGYLALQTKNLPEAPIANGRDHFQAITGPGTGGAAGNRQGTWMPDLFTLNTAGATRADAHVSTESIFHSSNIKQNAFDGNSGTLAETWQPEGRPAWMSFRPSDTTVPELTANTSFGIRVRRIAEVWVNGTQLTGDFTADTSTYDLSSQLTFPFTLESLEIKSVDTEDVGLYFIELDGEYLVQQGILETAQSTFPNGLYWIKDRANTNQHQLLDSVRGGDMVLHMPSTGYEDPYQAPAGNSIAWCWNAGGPAVTNNDGSIETLVSANTEGGFSILTYTGDGTTGATLGHGLTKAPEVVICKSRVTGQNFAVGSTYIDNWGTAMYLNNNQAKEPTNGGGFWNNTAPDNSVITLGNHPNINTAGQNSVCYAWHSVPGFSAFGSYTGNSDNEGTFIHTGFRPAWVMLRPINNANDWLIMDSTRSPFNPVQTTLKANTTQVENGSDLRIDMLSNGFKNRTNAGGSNGSQEYIYFAFAENPFSYPVTAR